MRLEPEEARGRFVRSAVARLATADGQGVPHIVPITFVVHQERQEDLLYFVIDQKPKSTWNLRRLRNIRQNDHVAVLVDDYREDWSALWWVRADGRADVWEEPARRELPVGLLREKYPQYREVRPEGPVVAVHVHRWSGWSSA